MLLILCSSFLLPLEITSIEISPIKSMNNKYKKKKKNPTWPEAQRCKTLKK